MKRGYEDAFASGEATDEEEEHSSDCDGSAAEGGAPELLSLDLVDSMLVHGSSFDGPVLGLLIDHGEACLDQLYARRLDGQKLADMIARQMYFAGDSVLPQMKAVEKVCKAIKVALNR